MPRPLNDGVLDNFNQRLGINGATYKSLGINGDGLGGVGRHLMLQCCKVGLVLKQECLVVGVGVGVGKIGYIGSQTGIVDAGVCKCSFFVVRGLHSFGEKLAAGRPGVLVFGHGIPLCEPAR